MHYTVLFVVVFAAVFCAVNALTIKTIDSPAPRTTTQRPTTLATTTVSPNSPVKDPVPNGPIVVLQNHGTLDGPSGRFRKTEFAASPPVDLSLPPVFLPEFIPIHEESQELVASASFFVPQFERTQNLASPPADLNRAPVFLPEATPIHEPSQESNAARQALYFVRG